MSRTLSKCVDLRVTDLVNNKYCPSAQGAGEEESEGLCEDQSADFPQCACKAGGIIHVSGSVHGS